VILFSARTKDLSSKVYRPDMVSTSCLMMPGSLSVGVKQQAANLTTNSNLVNCKTKVIPVQALKAYCESEGNAPLIPHLAQMEVIGKLHFLSVFPPGEREPGTH
jgi:hypothetical protein